MAVISLQASLLFELWVQRARTEPDQWDLSAGKSSQMQSLENEFPAVSQKRTSTDSCGPYHYHHRRRCHSTKCTHNSLQNVQLFSSLPKSLPAIVSQMLQNGGHTTQINLWLMMWEWRYNYVILTLYICQCCMICSWKQCPKFISKVPNSHNISMCLRRRDNTILTFFLTEMACYCFVHTSLPLPCHYHQAM